MPETSNGIVPYQNARRAGRRWVAEHARDKYAGGLAVLETELAGVETMGEVSLGIHEIPLKKIVGTYTSARADAFSGNFMPLLEEGTEFASKWRSLYGHHLRDGITDPIKVYEYMGLFYVIEGNKRVSVMNFVGAYSITADITRILPKYDENNEQIKIYYEILNNNSRSFAFSDMWFSHYGGFSALMWLACKFAERTPELAGKQPDEWVPSLYRDFAFQYSQAGFRDIDNMTTAEAFIIYVSVYDFPYNISPEELLQKIKSCEAQFRLADRSNSSGRLAVMPITIEEGGSSPTSGRGVFGIGGRRAKVVFVYGPPPYVSSWVRCHETGRHDLERFFEGRVTTEAVYGVDARDAYGELSRIIAEHKPDILFTVDADFAHASLQVGLENPNTLVFNCNHSAPNMRLNTYYLKMYEQFFVLGAIAGAYTKSDVIGIVDTPIKGSWPETHVTTYTLNAFVQGALLVNHNIKVKRCTPRVNFSHDEDVLCRGLLAARGCDVVLCHYPTYGAVALKPCDDLNAMLCSVYDNGRIKEYLAAPAMDWGVVYRRIVGDYLDGAFDHFSRDKSAPSLYFWLGLKCHAAKIYTYDAVLGSHTTRLARMLEQEVAQSHVHPLLGPIRDREGNLRIDTDKVPSLMEIQWMDWVCDIVDEEIVAGECPEDK